MLARYIGPRTGLRGCIATVQLNMPDPRFVNVIMPRTINCGDGYLYTEGRRYLWPHTEWVQVRRAVWVGGEGFDGVHGYVHDHRRLEATYREFYESKFDNCENWSTSFKHRWHLLPDEA